MANTIIAGYPTVWGNKITSTFDHQGPASYSNIGTSSGTGDVVKATDLGMGGFDFIDFQQVGGGNLYTYSGNFIVKIFATSSGTTPSGAFSVGGAYPQFILQWFTTSAAFGAISTEVANGTNLSAESIRGQVQGV